MTISRIIANGLCMNNSYCCLNRGFAIADRSDPQFARVINTERSYFQFVGTPFHPGIAYDAAGSCPFPRESVAPWSDRGFLSGAQIHPGVPDRENGFLLITDELNAHITMRLSETSGNRTGGLLKNKKKGGIYIACLWHLLPGQKYLHAAEWPCFGKGIKCVGSRPFGINMPIGGRNQDCVNDNDDCFYSNVCSHFDSLAAPRT